eukprot:3921191-Prymnesium_polylepis.1
MSRPSSARAAALGRDVAGARTAASSKWAATPWPLGTGSGRDASGAKLPGRSVCERQRATDSIAMSLSLSALPRRCGSGLLPLL